MTKATKANTRTFKTNKDPSYRIPTVKVIIDNGLLKVVRKDKGVRLEIKDLDFTKKEIILPSYEMVKG